MELIKEKWLKSDIKPFEEYLLTMKNESKMLWTKNLLNTNLICLAIKTEKIKKIAKEISKGNYKSFLDLKIYSTYDSYATNGFIISKIKDFDTFKKYLDIYSDNVDNWGLCDLLSVNIKNQEEKYLNLIKEYLKDKNVFKRRIAIRILFKFINYDNYVKDIFYIVDSLTNEQEYYVNMINAWLLCELFIKRKSETLKYLDNNHLNKFTINKMISKCRDSYRVSRIDKNLLLKYKK